MKKKILCFMVLLALVGGTGAFAELVFDAAIPVTGGDPPWVDFRFVAGQFDAFVGIRPNGFLGDDTAYGLRGGISLKGAQKGDAVFSFPIYFQYEYFKAKDAEKSTGTQGIYAGGRIDYAFSDWFGVFGQAAACVWGYDSEIADKGGKATSLMSTSQTEVGVLIKF
jgi:hypothetical protein